MKQHRTHHVKWLFTAALILLLAGALFLLRARMFMVGSGQLDAAAAKYDVRFFDHAHSFDIVPAKQKLPGTAMIFYPGALVDARAYAPRLAEAANTAGVPVFIAKPYGRLADLDQGAANGIMAAHPEIRDWYIGGHSMGGGAACGFAAKHPAQVRGLLLLAAYCSDAGRRFSGPVIALTGTNDTLEPAAKVRNHVPGQTIVSSITGANHASFGDYGGQPFDGRRTVSDRDMNAAIAKAVQGLTQLSGQPPDQMPSRAPSHPR